ncbi:MAG TPA: hypothetical protein VLH08_12265, partial [Acidobacteriota bacterium]|nr:hypothetical protein [Acidobacteriota bacterium]
MSRFFLAVLFVCLTINAFAAAQLWNENRKELVIFNSDGNAVKLRTLDRPFASKLSPDRSLTYTINSSGTRLDIYHNSTGTLKKSVDLNGRIKQVETNQSGSLLFLLDEASQSIRVFDA